MIVAHNLSPIVVTNMRWKIVKIIDLGKGKERNEIFVVHYACELSKIIIHSKNYNNSHVSEIYITCITNQYHMY